MVQAAKITIYSNDGTKIEQSGEISRLYSIINEPHNTFRLAIVRDDIGSTETRMLNKALWNKQDILNLFEY